MRQSETLGYEGLAKELLVKAGAYDGCSLHVVAKDGYEATGILIPRYEKGSRDYVVLKLKTGYNVGLDANKISTLEVLDSKGGENSQQPSSRDKPEKKNDPMPRRKTVLFLSTGGTIASRVDYRTGAVKPVISAKDLYDAMPELRKIADIQPEILFSEFSENLSSAHWHNLSEIIVARSKGEHRPSGIVVMLGTDTLGYVSAAISFSLFGLESPVVCVGAQRSSDRPSSDAALNLRGSTYFAAHSSARGVFVGMHQSENDDKIAIHLGTRVRKNHTSRRDAFESIDVPKYAVVDDTKITVNPEFKADDKIPNEKYHLNTNFSDSVGLVKFFPGLKATSLDYIKENKIRGLIVEGTGLGHVSSEIVDKLSDLVRAGTFVGITSQCIWGHVDLNVYETGSDLLDAGVVPLGNMLSETALTKLSWVLGNFPDQDPEKIMLENICGEITDRIVLSNERRDRDATSKFSN